MIEKTKYDYQWTVTPGGMWSSVIKRGKVLRLTDLEGGANVGMLLYNADHHLERYNMPDTLKGQHVFSLTSPLCLHSDMGRLFASILKDSVGWHDTVCGCSDAELVKEKYGVKNYQEARNDFYRNAQENFLIEMEKWGLGVRDLIPNLNLFSKVVSAENGDLTFVDKNSSAGDFIELRFEMDTLVILNTCQHPLDPNPEYQPKPVLMQVYDAGTPAADDASRLSRPENQRAMLNTENYYLLSR